MWCKAGWFRLGTLIPGRDFQGSAFLNNMTESLSSGTGIIIFIPGVRRWGGLMAFPFLQGFLELISGLIIRPTLDQVMLDHENGFTFRLSYIQGWLVDYRQAQEFHWQDVTGMSTWRFNHLGKRRWCLRRSGRRPLSVTTTWAFCLPVTNLIAQSASRFQDSLLQRFPGGIVSLGKLAFSTLPHILGFSLEWRRPKTPWSHLFVESAPGICVGCVCACKLLICLQEFGSSILEIHNKSGIIVSLLSQGFNCLIVVFHGFCRHCWLKIFVEIFGHQRSLVVSLQLGRAFSCSYLLKESGSKHPDCWAHTLYSQFALVYHICINQDSFLVLRRQHWTPQGHVCLKVT